MKKLLAIRIRGVNKTRKEIKDTLSFLHLNKNLSFVILDDNKTNRKMLSKVQNWVTWGEIDKDLKIKSLKPPKGGFKSIRRHYPKGDLGYRGKDIIKLVERMTCQ